MKRLERTRYESKKRKSYFNFECDCGNIVEKRSDTKTEFCCEPGCHLSQRKNHGSGNKTNKLYRRWEGMIGRCHGNHESSKTYKDRGISVCNEWRHDFPRFEQWALSNGFKSGLDIDRIDIDGNYEPSNCCFVSRSENVNRQHRDGHGTSVEILLSNDFEKHKFDSKKEAHDYMIKNHGCKIGYKAFLYHINKGVYNGWTVV